METTTENLLHKQTLNFRKRFNLLSMPMKLDTAAKLGNLVRLKIMPTGRDMTAKELIMLEELSEWCNDSILFNRQPNGSYKDFY